MGEEGECLDSFRSKLFAGRHFEAEIVVLCVRWYLRFKLSYGDLAGMMSERGIRLAQTAILRWVRHYTPEFTKRRKRYARPAGGSRRMDETYVKVRGEWVSADGDEGSASGRESDAGCVRGVTTRGG